ncbi:hypothetical protein B0H10DRAFT_2209891 [Mycena sp. CBHHK59/15]|nr:hypothetical protein B0H10DRAFT_2209891 [Mycena sp. CBHHK59/15]
MNSALRRDCILTNKIKFGPLALKKNMVLNTWSGLLMDEDTLPDDWTLTEGVLVELARASQTRLGRLPAEDAESPQDLLLENWGHLNLEPALFRARDPGYRTEMVLCTPGGAGTYFLWGHEMGDGKLHRFAGEYTGVEDFIENADWNRMALLPHLPCLW